MKDKPVDEPADKKKKVAFAIRKQRRTKLIEADHSNAWSSVLDRLANIEEALAALADAQVDNLEAEIDALEEVAPTLEQAVIQSLKVENDE